jgi:hypothetical protein
MDAKDRIAAIDRLIAQQMEYISTLEARLSARPDGEEQLENARLKLARLKEQKRTPATLLTVEHLLREGSLKESLKRAIRIEGEKNFYARADPGLRAALDAEQERINREHFKRRDSQREKSRKRRVNVSDLLANLIRRHADDATPLDLWPHMQSEIAEWFQCDCELLEDDKNPRYEYVATIEEKVLDGGSELVSTRQYKRKLSFKHFEGLLRKARQGGR